MEHDAPSMSNRDATDSLRARRRSISNGSNNKRTRLDGHGIDSNQDTYDNPHASSNAHLVPASTSGAPPVAYFAGPSSTSGYMASRPAEHASQRFPAATLRHPQPYNPSSDTIPPGWGPQARSTSFPSPPLASPLAGSPYSRRDSAYSTGVPLTSSPSASSNSSRGEDGRLPYAPMRAPDQNSSASSTPTPTFGAGHQYAVNANGFAAPFPPAHRDPTASTDNTNSSRHGPGSLTNIVDGFRATPPAAAQNTPQTSFAEPEPRMPFTADAVIRHFQQDVGRSSYSQTHTDLGRGTFSPAFRAWTRSHHGDGPNAQQAAPQLSRPTSSYPPAAPLHNILHPVDQTPSMSYADVPGQPGIDSQGHHSSTSNFVQSAASSTGSRNVFNQPSNTPSNEVSPSGNGAPPIAKTGNEIQIVPSASREESENNRRTQERRSRSTFSVDQRNETSQTRAIGACLRCKSQRVRCIPSPLGPFHPCLTCEQVSNNSKKVLHEIRCVRWRMVAMTTYRSGGLGLTRRWDGTTVQDVGDWTEIKTYEIGMKLFYSSHMHRYDLCDIPVQFRVRAFHPIEGDVLTRKWIKRIEHEDGTTRIEKRFVQLPAFALADANATVEIFREYFDRNAVHAMGHVAKHSHPAIRDHYEAAIAHYHSLPEGDVEKVFMQKFIKLWFCVRFTTGSSYIDGPEKLGCLPVNDPDYPLADKISVPRMITAQCDSIMVSRFLRPLTQDLIPEFEKFFRTGNPDNWFMLYVCTFILLAEVSFSCQDRRRHAQENWLKQKYSLPEFVGELQFGANIILCYWHYYRTMDPLDDGWDIFCKIIEPPLKPRLEIESAKGKGKKKVHLYRSQCDLVTRHWRRMVDLAIMMDTERYRECFEHPLYFVCQMYMKGWQIRDIYKRGPQEGPEETI